MFKYGRARRIRTGEKRYQRSHRPSADTPRPRPCASAKKGDAPGRAELYSAEIRATQQSKKRRAFLATAGGVAATGSAGCTSLLGDDRPSFEIRDVRVYQPNGQAVFVAPTVEKTGSGGGRLRPEARLIFSNTYDHGHEQEFVIPSDVDEYMYVLPFRWESPFLSGKTYDARAKIVEGGDAGWVDETERITSAPETGDDERNETD